MLKSSLAILTLLFTVGCSGFLYYPSRVRYTDPRSLSFTPEEVRFKDGDLEIVGWYFAQPKGKQVKARLLFFHGNGQNLSTHFASLYWLLSHGYEFLIYDYPGYGASHGEPTPENTVSSGIAALRWLEGRSPKLPVAFFGQSLGGAVSLATALEVKNQSPICMLVVESTFSSYRAVARDVLATKWWTWWLQPLTYLVLSDRYSPHGREDQLSPTPLLVIHGDKDQVVIFNRGEKLFAAAKEPKEFWRVPGGGHIDTFTGAKKDEFRPKLLAALEKNCSSETR